MIPADTCNLVDGQVHHYWFEVTDSHPQRSGGRIRVTDPMACTIDWRLMALGPDVPGYGDDERYPTAVVKYSQGCVIPCDAVGEAGELQNEPPLVSLLTAVGVPMILADDPSRQAVARDHAGA